MKSKTHPVFYDSANVTCACGNTFTIGSTLEKIRVELCSQCHPFYTGQMKFVDTKGRVERFQEKQKHAQKMQTILKEKRVKKQEETKRQENAPKTLREMLLGR
ncbi:50S ribosomal protein L31 [Candidatus Roizmanbacteria bacterium]|nr:50S ribosomal protein L31 [Candidatus Roizmanbacteria bacterium]